MLIAPIEAARGMSFDAVFVPGLAEKMFPPKIVEEPILLDAARQQIGGLATNQDRVEQERLALALAAGAAEGTDLLVLSSFGPQTRATTRPLFLRPRSLSSCGGVFARLR